MILRKDRILQHGLSNDHDKITEMYLSFIYQISFFLNNKILTK